jgi:ligand-binding SRPBCC domain-containing protein
MKIYIEIPVKSNAEKVIRNFNIDLFRKLKPPLTSLKILRYDGNQKGDEVHLKIGVLFFKSTWFSKISDTWNHNKEWGFEDRGIKLPFFLKSWKHKHRISKLKNSCIIIEDIDFEPKWRIFRSLIRHILYLQFKTRKKVYQREFGKP